MPASLRSPSQVVAAGRVRLRVTIWKSEYLTLSVTVRPRILTASQCRQTFRGQFNQHIAHRLERGQILQEGGLGPDGLADAVRTHRPLVHAARDPIIKASCLSEGRDEKRQITGAQIEPGVNAKAVHLSRGRWPDAVEFGHRQGFNETAAHLGRDHKQAVGLVLIGCQFGEELVVGDAGRRCEAGLGPDRTP